MLHLLGHGRREQGADVDRHEDAAAFRVVAVEHGRVHGEYLVVGARQLEHLLLARGGVLQI